MNSDSFDNSESSDSSDNSEDSDSSEIVEGFPTFKDLHRILYDEGNCIKYLLDSGIFKKPNYYRGCRNMMKPAGNKSYFKCFKCNKVLLSEKILFSGEKTFMLRNLAEWISLVL